MKQKTLNDFFRIVRVLSAVSLIIYMIYQNMENGKQIGYIPVALVVILLITDEDSLVSIVKGFQKNKKEDE